MTFQALPPARKPEALPTTLCDRNNLENEEPPAAAEDDPNGPPASDWQDGLAAVLETRGPQPNLSFFAFTATPKPRTLELFGRRTDSDKPRAIHVYSMRQAIEEVRKAVEGLLVQRVEENDAFVTRYLEDEAFQQVVFEGLAEAIFAGVTGEPPDGATPDRPIRH